MKIKELGILSMSILFTVSMFSRQSIANPHIAPKPVVGSGEETVATDKSEMRVPATKSNTDTLTPEVNELVKRLESISDLKEYDREFYNELDKVLKKESAKTKAAAHFYFSIHGKTDYSRNAALVNLSRMGVHAEPYIRDLALIVINNSYGNFLQATGQDSSAYVSFSNDRERSKYVSRVKKTIYDLNVNALGELVKVHDEDISFPQDPMKNRAKSVTKELIEVALMYTRGKDLESDSAKKAKALLE